jgi:putative glutamine amidotransferase
VNAVALLEAVRAAAANRDGAPGGPGGSWTPTTWADGSLRRRGAPPGGGDVPPRTTGPAAHGEVYDVDEVQDLFDLAVARWAMREGVPLLAVCRGLQVVNVAHGGTLEQHMEVPHRHVRHRVTGRRGVAPRGDRRDLGRVSCYHHQRIDRLGEGLHAVAHCVDGGVEAVESDRARASSSGVQWHPEDTAADDPAQARLFAALVDAAR